MVNLETVRRILTQFSEQNPKVGAEIDVFEEHEFVVLFPETKNEKKVIEHAQEIEKLLAQHTKEQVVFSGIQEQKNQFLVRYSVGQKIPYKYLPDEATADVAFEAYGRNLEEMVGNAGLATAALMCNLDTLEPKTLRAFKYEHKNIERLLFDFLEELIYLKDSENLLFKKFNISLAEKKEKLILVVEAWGDVINHKKHELGNDVKAVTYHKFSVEKTDDGYKCFVILDI